MSWFSVQPPSSSDHPPQSNPSSQPSSPPLGPGLLHPVSARYSPDELFGTLNDQDTAWLAQASGFVTETQTFYLTLPGGKLVMCQIIHSAIGVWYPQIQFTFRYYDPSSKSHIWKSTNVSNFKTPPPSGRYDRRSCQADQFSVLLDPSQPDTYTLTGKHDDSVKIQFTVQRPADVPGWKIGQDTRGGFTYFGNHNISKKESSKDPQRPDYSAGTDGYLVHRFWPRCFVSGQIVLEGREIDLTGARAIFIHAVQGMRPNLIASRWNFCNFQTVPSLEDGADDSNDPGVSLTLMEFTSVPGSYGPAQAITVGSIVVDNKLVAVACGPSPHQGVEAHTTHQEPFFHDPVTGYSAPSSVRFQWQAPSILPASKEDSTTSGDDRGSSSEIVAQIDLDLEAPKHSNADNYVTKGLIEKVDVMAQIPYLVKKVVAAVAGTRPYIYTWMNPVSATISLPKQLIPSSRSDLKSDSNETPILTVDGYIFNEATFISE